MRTLQSRDLLLLCAGAGIGGMERVVLNLARELPRRGLIPRVILPEDPATHHTLRWYAAEGVTAEVQPCFRHSFGRHHLSDVPALRDLIARSPASVVSLHYCRDMPSINDLIAIRMAGKRCVVSLHVVCGGENTPRRIRKVRLAASLCDRIVVVSEYQRRAMMRSGIPREKITVIPCGVPVPDLLRDARPAARERLRVPADAFVIATVARLDASKGVADLIEAASRLPQGAEKILLLIAGDGPERANLERLAATGLSGRYRFLGHVTGAEAIGDVYRASDLFVLPSRNETFGQVFAEAGAFGLPCVGYAVGGVPETVVAGATGLLLAPGDIGGLVNAIASLRADPRRRADMGRRAWAHTRIKFTIPRMTDRYINTLSAALRDDLPVSDRI